MITDKIPTIVFRLNKDNYEEILNKCPKAASLISNGSEKHTPWTSSCQTQWFFEEHGIAAINDRIQRLSKKHGFSHFKTSHLGGSCLNVVKGVSVNWRLLQYRKDGERGYYFSEVWFRVRKAKTLNGYSNKETFKYQETTYVEVTPNFTIQPLAVDDVDESQITLDADTMFREAFKYAEGLQGDQAITQNSLKAQILQNVVMSTLFKKIKKEVSFQHGEDVVRFDFTFNPAKAPEDSCNVDVHMTFEPKEGMQTCVNPMILDKMRDHSHLKFGMSQTSFFFVDRNLSWDQGFDKAVDFSDPTFDTDKFYIWICGVLEQYVKTAYKIAELKLQIIGLHDTMEALSQEDTKLFNHSFDKSFSGGPSTN